MLGFIYIFNGYTYSTNKSVLKLNVQSEGYEAPT